MRVDIKTKGQVKDNDVRALYLIREALKISSPHMREANIRVALESYKRLTLKKQFDLNKQTV